MKKILFWTLFFVSVSTATAADSTAVEKPSFFERIYEAIKDFSRIDTNYIEPQHYNFTVMLQNTNTYEAYTLRSKSGQELVLSPKPSIKIGPYAGWRWLVLGYTIDISHLRSTDQRQDWNISLYSNQIGIDLFYRKTGSDYRIRLAKLGNEAVTAALDDVGFDGFRASVKGFNLYYILNHKKFSYPAAFNQSTCQKISCGSPMVGIGYTQHSLNLDVAGLNSLIEQHIGSEAASHLSIDSSLVASKVNYADFSASGGYGYNWAFAKNWVAAASLMLSIGYKRSTGELERDDALFREFSFRNFNFDGVGRFGVVWNNTRWYAGASAIFHTYNYAKSQFSTNTTFGNLNIYVGVNFGNRHRPKKTKIHR